MKLTKWLNDKMYSIVRVCGLRLYFFFLAMAIFFLWLGFVQNSLFAIFVWSWNATMQCHSIYTECRRRAQHKASVVSLAQSSAALDFLQYLQTEEKDQ